MGCHHADMIGDANWDVVMQEQHKWAGTLSIV